MATDHCSISSSRLPSTLGSKVQLAGWEHSQTHLALFKETKSAQSQLRYHLVQDAIQGQTAPRLRLADSGTSFPPEPQSRTVEAVETALRRASYPGCVCLWSDEAPAE